jgi:hypothetical protein
MPCEIQTCRWAGYRRNPEVLHSHDNPQTTFRPHPSNTKHLSPGHNTPCADQVISVTSEQSLAISGPGEGNTLWLTALLANSWELWLELINLGLLLEVEDDDGGRGGGAEPVSVWREDQGVNLITGIEGVEVLGLVKIPEHGGSVLATGGAERSIWGDGDGVDVTGVADVVGLETAGRELPNLICQLVLKISKYCSILAPIWVTSEIGECLSHGPKALK